MTVECRPQTNQTSSNLGVAHRKGLLIITNYVIVAITNNCQHGRNAPCVECFIPTTKCVNPTTKKSFFPSKKDHFHDKSHDSPLPVHGVSPECMNGWVYSTKSVAWQCSHSSRELKCWQRQHSASQYHTTHPV